MYLVRLSATAYKVVCSENSQSLYECMVLPRLPLLIGRMIVNKWMIVGFIIAFVILEVQILQTSVPARQNGMTLAISETIPISKLTFTTLFTVELTSCRIFSTIRGGCRNPLYRSAIHDLIRWQFEFSGFFERYKRCLFLYLSLRISDGILLLNFLCGKGRYLSCPKYFLSCSVFNSITELN